MPFGGRDATSTSTQGKPTRQDCHFGVFALDTDFSTETDMKMFVEDKDGDIYDLGIDGLDSGQVTVQTEPDLMDSETTMENLDIMMIEVEHHDAIDDQARAQSNYSQPSVPQHAQNGFIPCAPSSNQEEECGVD